jgi:arginine deiminase
VHTVLAVPIAQERATMHLDTVFTFCNTDVLTAFAPVIDNAKAIS